MKTHAKVIVDLKGNYVETHLDKRRGRMDIEREALNHWIGPPLAKTDRLGEASLDRVFGRNMSKANIYTGIEMILQ